MTLVSLAGDVISYTRTILIRQTVGGKKVFMWNEHRLLFSSVLPRNFITGDNVPGL